jgi:hypothetical protein
MRVPGICPACGERDYLRDRCSECALTRLEEAMDSPAGAMYKRCAELKFALRERFAISLDDLTMEEFAAFQMASSEQARFEEQERKINEAKARQK